MKLVVGLGNPGGKFEYTRHNIGFMVVDRLAKDLLPVGRSQKAWSLDKKTSSLLCRVSEDLIIMKPQTYMNNSGSAVLQAKNFYKADIKDIFVVHDDIDLPLGKIRIRTGGASAGHRGIESIITHLHDPGFARLRLGIGRGKLDKEHSADHNLRRQDVEKFVISLFRDNEAGEVKKIIKNASEALQITLKKGIETAMNRFN